MSQRTSGQGQEMQVSIATTLEECDVEAYKILEDQPCVMGLDTESTVEVNKNHGKVSLIQMAYYHNDIVKVYLFQVYRAGGVSPYISRILKSEKIIKVGVDIRTDVYRIEFSYNVASKGWIDLQHIAHSMRIAEISLASLANRFITYRKVDKDAMGHRGDWDGTLTLKQQHYAAMDAVVSLEIYMAMFQIARPTGPIGKEVECPDEKTTSRESKELLYLWIQDLWRTPYGSHDENKLCNQIVNSFAPWKKLFVEKQRRDHALRILGEFIQEGRMERDKAGKLFLREKRVSVAEEKLLFHTLPRELNEVLTSYVSVKFEIKIVYSYYSGMIFKGNTHFPNLKFPVIRIEIYINFKNTDRLCFFSSKEEVSLLNFYYIRMHQNNNLNLIFPILKTWGIECEKTYDYICLHYQDQNITVSHQDFNQLLHEFYKVFINRDNWKWAIMNEDAYPCELGYALSDYMISSML